MSIDQVSAASTQSTATSATTGGFSSDDFMKLLIAQLQNQDPLEPMKPEQFMGQLAQLQSVTELSQLDDTMSSMASSQQMTGLAGLLGHTVTWTDSAGGTHSAKVTGLSRESGTTRLVAGSDTIDWSSVSSVT
jgi:flagellar basal-body rod modification protein FlgD